MDEPYQGNLVPADGRSQEATAGVRSSGCNCLTNLNSRQMEWKLGQGIKASRLLPKRFTLPGGLTYIAEEKPLGGA